MSLRYFEKSSYKQSDFKFTILKILTFILLMSDIFWMFSNKDTILCLIGFIFIDLVSILYFVLRTVFIKNNIKCNKLELTYFSNKIIKRHFIILDIFILLINIHIASIIFNIVNANYEVEPWIWFAILLPVLYSDNVYLSGITAFGENLYASGEYLIDYSAINRITEICNVDTMPGNIIMTL